MPIQISIDSFVVTPQPIGRLPVRIASAKRPWEEYGPYTGAISPLVLKECGVQVVQIGHSERRQLFAETDASVNRKVLASLKHGFVALVCVGETAEDKNWGVSLERVREQTKIALGGIEPSQLDRLWIAYEPAWAIGPMGAPPAQNTQPACSAQSGNSCWSFSPHTGVACRYCTAVA